MRERKSKTETTAVFAARLGGLIREVQAANAVNGKPTSQGKIADAMGIKRPALNRYLDDDMEIGINSLVKAAQHLGVSTDYLLGLINVRSPNAIVQNICQATGLDDSALSALQSMTKPTPEPSTDPDLDPCEASQATAYKTMQLPRSDTDDFYIIIPSFPTDEPDEQLTRGTKAAHSDTPLDTDVIVQNIQPSRRTTINLLLRCPGFVSVIDHLRASIAAGLTVDLNKQYKDIYPHSNSDIEIHYSEQYAGFTEYTLQKDIASVLQQLTQAYTQKHQAEIDAALEQYKRNSIAYEQFRDDYTAMEDSISSADNNREG